MSGMTHLIEREEIGSGPKFDKLWLTLAAVPLLSSALLMVFAIDTWRRTGLWPSYGNPDPKDASQLLYWATGAGFLLSVPSCLAVCIGLCGERRFRLGRRDWALIAFSLLGLAVLSYLLGSNLGNWYMD